MIIRTNSRSLLAVCLRTKLTASSKLVAGSVASSQRNDTKVPHDRKAFASTCATAFLFCLAITIGGCSQKSDDSKSTASDPKDALQQMRYNVLRLDFEQAAQYTDAVLQEHGDDPEVLALVAKVSHGTDKPQLAAEMLVKACAAESYADEKRVQQAMIAMIGVGRLHDGMDLLQAAIDANPQQNETRRWLYDFYMGTEDRERGLPHGHVLVKQRKFDIELLLSLTNTETRSMDSKPLQEMARLNTDDKRPLIGDAKAMFDRGDLKDAIKSLKSILETHPKYLPAQSLLCAAYSSDGKFDELKQFAAKTSDGIESYAPFWIAMGDWSRENSKPKESIRAYWEATKRDPDRAEAWVKLGTALSKVKDVVSASDLQAVQNRASQLSRFVQQRKRFERSGKISRETAAEMAKTLHKLGRIWEAEAWSAIAITLPEDESVDIDSIRKKIVADLTAETPWQKTNEFAEFDLDFRSLAVPNVGAVALKAQRILEKQMIEPISDPETLPADVNYSLQNQAKQRGIDFFGRTGDNLDQAGIMLHRTLGCGGGTIDFDRDGWSDLYLIAAGGTPAKQDSQSNALMRNIGGSFVDISNSSETGDRGFGQGVAVGDVNEDGFHDLLVLNYGANRLLINQGDGTFIDRSEKWLPDNSDRWSASAAIADLDGDAITDIVIVNYCAGIEPSTRTCPMEGTEMARSCTPMLFPGEPDRFLKGLPDGRFADRTTRWNATPEVKGRGLGIEVGSFDENAGLDVFIANDMTANHFWSHINTSSEPFELSESAIVRGLGGDGRSQAQGSMGIATGDFDSDGDVDFYVTNFDGEYNTLHEQLDAGLWQDQTQRRNMSSPTSPLVGFGTEAVDLDNDGQMEIVLTNGHVDIFSRDNKRSIYDQPMQIFRRTNDGAFQSVGEQMKGDYLSGTHVGRGLWTIDANRDAMVDMVITHQTEPVALLINESESKGDWLAFELHGTGSSRDAIGAVVEITVDGFKQTVSLTAGSGYLCSNESILRFAIPKSDSPQSQPEVSVTAGSVDVRVTWPGGDEVVFANVRRNTAWSITQGDRSPHQMDNLRSAR